MAGSKNRDTNYIREVISRAYPFRDWLVLDEFPLSGCIGSQGTPRIDILAIKVGNGGGYGMPLTREAFEIKVNRRDFLEEIKNTNKRRRAYAVCDAYWFAVPEGLVEADEVPRECGLMKVSRNSPVPCVAKTAPMLPTKPPSPFFMMDVARRAYQVGRRFDLVCNLVYLLMKKKVTKVERTQAVRALSTALASMQRRTEARELSRIAAGGEPLCRWFVAQTLESGLKSTDAELATSDFSHAGCFAPPGDS
jgi:hypothetical protein